MKPYQKKHKRMDSKRNTPWTDEDRDLLRTLHTQGISYYAIARRLGRSHGAIAQQVYLMKQRDAAENYVYVSGTLTTEDATMDVSSDTTTSTLKRWWARLFGSSDMGAQ